MYEITYPRGRPLQSKPTQKSSCSTLLVSIPKQSSPLLQIQKFPLSDSSLSIPNSVKQGPSTQPDSALLSMVIQGEDHVLQPVQGAQELYDLALNSDDQEKERVKLNTKEIAKMSHIAKTLEPKLEQMTELVEPEDARPLSRVTSDHGSNSIQTSKGIFEQVPSHNAEESGIPGSRSVSWLEESSLYLEQIKDTYQVFDKTPIRGFRGSDSSMRLNKAPQFMRLNNAIGFLIRASAPTSWDSQLQDSRHSYFVAETIDKCHDLSKDVVDYEILSRSLLGIHSPYQRLGGMSLIELVCSKNSRAKWIIVAAYIDDICSDLIRLEPKFARLGIEFMPYDRGKFSLILDDEVESKLTVRVEVFLQLSNMFVVLFVTELEVHFSGISATFEGDYAESRSQWDPSGIMIGIMITKLLDWGYREMQDVFLLNTAMCVCNQRWATIIDLVIKENNVLCHFLLEKHVVGFDMKTTGLILEFNQGFLHKKE